MGQVCNVRHFKIDSYHPAVITSVFPYRRSHGDINKSVGRESIRYFISFYRRYYLPFSVTVTQIPRECPK